MKADGDTSGTSGHFHLFIDRDPTGPRAPIPVAPGIIHTAETVVALPAFTTPGEHTVWVVAGDGTHVPLTPPVADRLTITVT